MDGTLSSSKAGEQFPGSMTGGFGIKANPEGGFSLTELLVAAFILSLVTISMVSVLRAVKGMEYSDMHRRQAKALLDSCLESHFHHSEYSTIQPETVSVSNIIIDPREAGAGDDLTGTLDKEISEDSNYNTNFLTKTIILNLSWEEPEEGTQEITMSKVITSLP